VATANLEHISMGGVPDAPAAVASGPARPVSSRDQPDTAPPQQPSATACPPSPPAPATTRREPKQARFVSADATKTRIQLGGDGQLPELTLMDGEPGEKKIEEENQSSSPWLLIGVLFSSFVICIAMLFLDVGPDKSGEETKAKVRGKIEKHYIGEAPQLEEYQLLLRRALQANTRGDYRTERRLYRRVLDMLHAEDKNNDKGLTGMREDLNNTPPNDRHLEQLLSRLLSD